MRHDGKERTRGTVTTDFGGFFYFLYLAFFCPTAFGYYDMWDKRRGGRGCKIGVHSGFRVGWSSTYKSSVPLFGGIEGKKAQYLLPDNFEHAPSNQIIEISHFLLSFHFYPLLQDGEYRLKSIPNLPLAPLERFLVSYPNDSIIWLLLFTW